MLDINFIIQNKELVNKCAENKKFPINIDKIINLYNEIKSKTSDIIKLRSKKNIIAKSQSLNDTQKKEGKLIKIQIKDLENSVKLLKTEYNELILKVPNVHSEEVPVGISDEDNVEKYKVNDKPVFNFSPKSHIELGEKLDILDFKSAVELGGPKTYFLKNEATLLENAVLKLGIDNLVNLGYTPISVPLLLKEDVMEGTGYFPHSKEQTYHISKDNLYLTGTSEVPLCALFKNKILTSKDLPIKLLSVSTCFRREAGTYGKYNKGLYRVHQFQKVEQVIISKNDNDESHILHNELLGNAESFMKQLGLHYRVLNVCSGDLGMGQFLKHDIEAWIPSLNIYGETHSCSTLHDYQSRRLNIRYKDENNKIHFAHTLNSTYVASPRILIPILECNQMENGDISIPKELVNYMYNKTHIIKK